MRLQTVGLPVAHHRTGADLEHSGHLAGAPVRGRFRLGLRGQCHQLGHIHLDWWPTARQVPLDACKARFDVALPPATRCDPVNAQLLGNLKVLQALRCQQHDAGALGQSNAARLGVCQSNQLRLFFFAQFDRSGNSHFVAPGLSVVDHWSQGVQLSFMNSQTLH